MSRGENKWMLKSAHTASSQPTRGQCMKTNTSAMNYRNALEDIEEESLKKQSNDYRNPQRYHDVKTDAYQINIGKSMSYCESAARLLR